MKPNAILTLIFSGILGYSALAQTPANPKLDSLIHKNAFYYKDGTFKGEGWEFLKKEIQQSQIIVIGEQHGIAEIPMFCGKVAEIQQPKALIGEIDPYTAEQLEKISVDTTRYSTYFKQKPYDFAFFSWKTELALARKMVLSHISIWGVNEINFLSLPTFFEKLASLAKSPANKKAALEKAAAYAKNDLPLYGDINKYNDFIAYRIKETTVDSLIYAFRKESPRSKKMLNDLKLSLPIFANTDYQLRVNLMKKNLLNYLQPYITTDAITIPKLLFKLGANHGTRAETWVDTPEVCSLADNLADASGTKSLHMLVLGKQGTINTMAPVNNAIAIQPYDGVDDMKGFETFFSLVEKDEWSVYDLRPIRFALKTGKVKISNSELKKYVLGYDLLVLFDKTTGNKFIE